MVTIAIIVDMQNDFVNPRGALFSERSQAVVQPIVRYFQEHSFDKIYALLDTHNADYLSTQEGQKLPVKHCIDGEWGHQLDEDIQRLPIDKQLCKPTFGYVHWVDWLTQEGILDRYASKDICFTLCGVDTDICVITNVLLLKTFFPEAQINVLEPLCAGTSIESHQAAIAVMKNCQINIVY